MGIRKCLVLLTLIGLFGPLGQVNAQESKSKYEQLIDKKKKLSGMWTLYQSDQQLLAEISSTALKKEYIVIPSISQGISRGDVLGGMSWGFGDEIIWSLKLSGEKLFISQKNARFRAKSNSPEETAVKLAYSDSILFALPVLTKSPSGGILVDVTRVFMNDDLEVGRAIGSSFRLMTDRSTFSKIKAFEENIEIGLNTVFSGSTPIETVPNSKGVQVGIHYSVSVLPSVGSNGYKPRMADDRVGYFLTAIKDFSDKDEPEHFVRYVNRWNLQKLDPSIDRSPPKTPIKFYLENTVPIFLRPTVEAGILEWNKAFDKLGFAGAIRVDQQPVDDPDFDPENINYNTFRWITADAGFAMGPSRVDPRSGQILDADIIFDASFLDSWNRRWEIFRPEESHMFQIPESMPAEGPLGTGHLHGPHCTLGHEMQRQSATAAAMFMAVGVSKDGNLPDEFIHQGLKEVVMHEVGHTLGLRHNFKASAWKTLEEIDDPEADAEVATVASVMDYSPANVVIDREKQGLYYSQTIGPYDYWAIEYGYKPISGSEKDELNKIASRSGEPELEYGTDEDTRSIDPDPHSNRFDLGKDPLKYVRRQMEQSIELLPKIVESTVKEGDGYQRARQAFGLLLGQYAQGASFASRFPGGVSVHRDHKGDEDGQSPFAQIPAEKQREAMDLIAESVFASPAIKGSDLNYLAASRWSHWGTSSPSRLDYPIHDTILSMQETVLGNLLSSIVLERILDNEFKAAEEDDVYTLAEHERRIVEGIFSELDQEEAAEFTNKEPMISSFRRNLQRTTIRRLGSLISSGYSAPSDARTLARMHLGDLKDKATQLLENEEIELDDYSRAHLQESVALINKVLDAQLSLQIVY
ncbi:zinc-dependent metalloprotease [Thalassoglobus sp. JC818]|uniref:zinc-dependent metalloprotease n=1 Tax=Thalassoglobus sp. JC818 TaxID=3232136 RepID=UPI00345A0CCA